MVKRVSAVLALALLVVGVISIAMYAVEPAYAIPSNDHGCYCHHNGIGMWVNGTDIGDLQTMNVSAGATFHLEITSQNVAAQGVVPGMQVWMQNMSNNTVFQFRPSEIAGNTSQDLNSTTGAITGLYAITAPTEGGSYTITIFAQGQPFDMYVDVLGASSTTSTVGVPSSNSTMSTVSVQSSLSTTHMVTAAKNMLAGFPGLNLITLYVTGTVALVFGVLLGVGVALRAKKMKTVS